MSKSFYDAPGVEERCSEIVASRRIGRPEDIASVVLFLTSNGARYVNGAEIVADGGFGCMLMDLVPRPGYSRAGVASTVLAQRLRSAFAQSNVVRPTSM
jgi:hypothetical protein